MSKIKNAFIKAKNAYDCYMRRRRLKYKDFTIISNNCWGGFVYQMFGLEYTTPTIGLFIEERDYVKFCADMKRYLELPLEFIEAKESKYYELVSNNGKEEVEYPVARLGDIEVFFMHYHSKEEAIQKWNRRKKRINYDRILYKMSWRNDCDEQTAKEFLSLPHKNKICFTEKEMSIDGAVFVPEFYEFNKLGGDETEITLKHVDIYKVLDSLK